MSEIKTAEEILQNQETYDFDYPTISLHDAEKAMKEYAAQFIDLAAKEADAFLVSGFDGEDVPVVSEGSILKIKDLIK